MEVHIATVADLTEGRVISSRLRAEGIPCRLQSESLGPFVVNVGSMAQVDIFVPQEFEETARAVLAAASNSDSDPETGPAGVDGS